MKRFFVLFLAMVALLPISSALADYLPLTVKNGDSISICARQYYEIELDGEPDREIEWSTSDEDVFWVTKSLGKYVLIASGQGSAYLNGKALDGSGEKVKVKITVPKVYTTHDKIVIDSPEGVEFGYAFNMSGYLSVSHSGKCFTTEKMDDVGEISMTRIKPVKVGTGSIVFTGNGKTVKTVKIEVKKSAFEEKADTDMAPSADGVAIAVVTKNVNIRSKANADSKKVGSAKAGDRLTVTKAFYSEKWHQILYDGELCYVSANYCDIEYIEPDATPIPTDEPVIEPTKTPVILSESVETKLDQYIRKWRLTSECKSVIVNYLPDINNFDRIELDGTKSYFVIMNDGTTYCLTVFENKYPACLQSSEKDYKSRTRYYDYFAQFSNDDSGSTISYVGNENTEIFHYDNCPHVYSTKNFKRVDFSSREEAIAKGYMTCAKCNP